MIIISSYVSTFSAWWTCWVLAYSLGNGLTYLGPVHHGWLWIPDKPGLVSGIILAGYGFSCLIFNNVAVGK